MSFVDHYLPYFRQQLITGPLLALLLFQSLFTEILHAGQVLTPPPFSCAATYQPPSVGLSAFPVFAESSCGDQLLALPPFSVALRAPCSLCCVFLFSYLFIIQVFLFFFL
jgi:hypothetical protein